MGWYVRFMPKAAVKQLVGMKRAKTRLGHAVAGSRQEKVRLENSCF